MTASGRRTLLTIFLITVSIASAQDFKKQVIYQIITDRLSTDLRRMTILHKARDYSIRLKRIGISSGAAI